MLFRVISCLVVLAAVFVRPCLAEVPHNTLTPGEKATGWRLLFDGKTLDGWGATGEKDIWRVVDGELVNDAPRSEHGPRGYLYTKERFGNFSLYMEFKITPAANSGLVFRWDNLDDPIYSGIELQIYDSYKDLGTSMEHMSNHHCGSVYDIAAPRYNVYKPAGEWNTLSLTCRDNLVWVTMNGKRIVFVNLDRWTTPGKNPDGSENKFPTAYKDMPREGHIGLQDYRGVISVRNFKIQPL